MKKLLTIIGTRPEAIKMAPVVHALRRRPDECEVVLCSSGQHREMVGQALEVFDLAPDLTLDVMRPDQDLCGLTGRLFDGLGKTIAEVKPDWVIAQGDTTTVMVSAVAAFYSRVRFGHVEAGLRTGDLRHPFPEEMNRVFSDRIADLHFAPTDGARDALLAEGIGRQGIHLTGNTVVDAVDFVRREGRLQRPAGLSPQVGEGRINPLSPHLRSPQPRSQEPHLKSKFLAI